MDPGVHIFRLFFTLKRGKIGQNSGFHKVCKVFRMIHNKLFYNNSSLELQLEVCRIWAYGAPGAQVDNGQWELWDQICVRHILETTGPIFIIKKNKSHMKALGPQMCTGLIIFPWCPLGPEKGPWGPNLVQHICGRPLGWFSGLTKHMPLDLGYMLVCRFPYGPKDPKSFSLLAQFSGFVDNFVSYAAKGQQSLWGHEVSC